MLGAQNTTNQNTNNFLRKVILLFIDKLFPIKFNPLFHHNFNFKCFKMKFGMINYFK